MISFEKFKQHEIPLISFEKLSQKVPCKMKLPVKTQVQKIGFFIKILL